MKNILFTLITVVCLTITLSYCSQSISEIENHDQIELSKKENSLKFRCIDPSKIDTNAVCDKIYEPVCGCNNITYGNACEAKAAGVTSYKEGACSDTLKCLGKPDSNLVCLQIYDPVCGCNGKTYGNACEAKAAGVLKYTSGPCKKQCIDSTKIDPKRPCPLNYDPVCGCDGKTYGNACEAERAGVTRYSKGACKKS